MLKFFFTKVSLSILHSALKEIDFTEDRNTKAVYSKKFDSVLENYKISKTEIEKLVATKATFGIGLSQNHLSTPYEKFENFKDSYRTFLGYIFTQVHSNPIKEK